MHRRADRGATRDAMLGAGSKSDGIPGDGAGREFVGEPPRVARGGAAAGRSLDRVSDVSERTSTGSTGCRVIEPRQQGDCLEVEYHRPHRKIPYLFSFEQVWSGDAGGAGATGFWLYAADVG